MAKAGKVTATVAEGTKANLLKLIDKKIDCYMNDGLSIEWELKHLAKKGEYGGSSIVRGATISAESGFLGFAASTDAFPYKENFKQQYLKALRELKASGKVEKIIPNTCARINYIWASKYAIEWVSGSYVRFCLITMY